MKEQEKYLDWRKYYSYVGPIGDDLSWQLMEKHKLTYLEEPVKFEDIADKNRIEILQEYRILNALFNQKYYQDKLAKMTPQNQKHFRYIDTVAYENNRVLFPKEVKPNYINASWIYSEIKGKARIIATQGPLPDSIGHFWRMVFQQRSPVIVMLCNLVENDRVKCEKYWPELGETKQYQELTVTMVQQQELMKGVTRRDFKIKAGDEEHTTSQLHYKVWPDFGIPDKVGQQGFIGVVSFLQELRKTEKERPIITHCSAGVGRTGTLISILELFEIIEEQEGERKFKDRYFSIFGMVRRLREMRIMMVQSEDQYQFIYDMIKKGFNGWIKEQQKGKY